MIKKWIHWRQIFFKHETNHNILIGRDVHPGTTGTTNSSRVVVSQSLGMKNPALRLVGIASSPGGGGVFGNRAEEELRLWLESRLDALGIDPVAYSRFILSLLRHPDSVLSPSLDIRGRRNRLFARVRLPLPGETEQRRAVVQCLINAADQKCGVESLVDELCAKLRDLEGGGTHANVDECVKLESGVKSTSFDSLSPRDKTLRYYAAFPALQPAIQKKKTRKKDRNLGTAANNKKRSIGVNGNNNKHRNKNSINTTLNDETRHKKNKMFARKIESHRTTDKETFGFLKSIESEREKERELELDELRLAQLQAKFDESLEALWDSGPGNYQDKASIWAAPSLSIPSGPLWPIDSGELAPIFPFNDASSSTTPHQESLIDNSPIIPWDNDSFAEKCINGDIKNKLTYDLNWSDYIGDRPWCWSMNRVVDNSPQEETCFVTILSCKTPTDFGTKSNAHTKIPFPKNIGDNDDNSDNNDDGYDDYDDDAVAAAADDGKKDVDGDDDDDGDNHENEDLLTSARTHFCPIKDDGNWADGTTFPVNNHFERVAYRRSESGNLLYLPGGESPYLEYKGDAIVSQTSGFTLKFRVRQCDKSIQTDPIKSPIKRRIIAEEDRFYHSLVDNDDASSQDANEGGKDSFTLSPLGWMQMSVSLLNDRKRRHSSSFRCRPLADLRPLTL